MKYYFYMLEPPVDPREYPGWYPSMKFLIGRLNVVIDYYEETVVLYSGYYVNKKWGTLVRWCGK